MGTYIYSTIQERIYMRNKVDRLESAILQGDSAAKVVSLDRDIFLQKLSNKLDTIEKKTGVPSKEVTYITEVHYHYEDTSTIKFTPVEVSPSILDIGFSTGPCWGYEGVYDLTKNKVTLSKRWSKVDIDIFGYTQRDRLFNKAWLPKWGVKRIYLGLINNCEESTTTATEYSLEKR